jgi:hypothetical protein
LVDFLPQRGNSGRFNPDIHDTKVKRAALVAAARFAYATLD